MSEENRRVCISCYTDLSTMPTTIPGMDELFKYCSNDKCYRFGLVTTLIRVSKSSKEETVEIKEN